MVLQVRRITGRERAVLDRWTASDDREMQMRARIILLSNEGYRVPEIGAILGRHPTNLRKWIHRFNEHGCQGLTSKRSGGRPPHFTDVQKQQIVSLAQTNPRELGLNFSRWTLHRLAAEARRREVVDRISHEYVRQILYAAGHTSRGNGKTNGKGKNSARG